MVDDPLRRIVAGFVSEAQELVEAVIRRLLELEGAGPNDAKDTGELEGVWEDAARGLHTLKGGAGSLGMDALARLAHKMEDLLDPYRQAKRGLPPAAVDAILKGLDAFMVGVRATAADSKLPDLSVVLANLAAHLPAPGPALAARAPPTRAPVPTEELAEPSPPSLAPRSLPLPGEPLPDPAALDRGWRIKPHDILALVRELDRMREVRLRLDERRREIAALEAASAERPLTPRSLLPSLSALGRALRSEALEVAQIVEAIEDRLRDLGAQPVRTILEQLRRLVRDGSRAKGKLAKLSVVGEDISLDRNVLQGLRESLVHMIRNAIDHGIELPGDRERAGKHRQGAIVLRIEQHGNVLYVELSDDGAGLDLERLRAVAVERGLLGQAEAGALEPKFLSQMIFGSGLTTSAKVTETSGRGVGLDAVRAWTRSLRGHVEAHSVAGQGTRFAFTLPIELGSSPLLVVRAGDQELGIPLAAVERVVSATRHVIVSGASTTELQYGERRIALSDLATILALRQPSHPVVGQPAVVIQSQGARHAILVDEVIGDLDLVIRPLPPEVRDIAAFQGAATTSRGELLLILRPTWLVSLEVAQARPAGDRRALVVDDSLTARALHRAMLEAGGFTVHVVSSAEQALEWMGRGRYDVVVCDFAMASMDGIAFTAAVRSSGKLQGTPIVLVSARDESSVRERAIEAGADAFLSKAECAAGRLLAVVSQVVARRGVAA